MWGDGVLRWFPPIPTWEPGQHPDPAAEGSGFGVMIPVLILVALIILFAALSKVTPPRYPTRRKDDDE